MNTNNSPFGNITTQVCRRLIRVRPKAMTFISYYMPGGRRTEEAWSECPTEEGPHVRYHCAMNDPYNVHRDSAIQIGVNTCEVDKPGPKLVIWWIDTAVQWSSLRRYLWNCKSEISCIFFTELMDHPRNSWTPTPQKVIEDLRLQMVGIKDRGHQEASSLRAQLARNQASHQLEVSRLQLRNKNHIAALDRMRNEQRTARSQCILLQGSLDVSTRQINDLKQKLQKYKSNCLKLNQHQKNLLQNLNEEQANHARLTKALTVSFDEYHKQEMSRQYGATLKLTSSGAVNDVSLTRSLVDDEKKVCDGDNDDDVCWMSTEVGSTSPGKIIVRNPPSQHSLLSAVKSDSAFPDVSQLRKRWAEIFAQDRANVIAGVTTLLKGHIQDRDALKMIIFPLSEILFVAVLEVFDAVSNIFHHEYLQAMDFFMNIDVGEEPSDINSIRKSDVDMMTYELARKHYAACVDNPSIKLKLASIQDMVHNNISKLWGDDGVSEHPHGVFKNINLRNRGIYKNVSHLSLQNPITDTISIFCRSVALVSMVMNLMVPRLIFQPQYSCKLAVPLEYDRDTMAKYKYLDSVLHSSRNISDYQVTHIVWPHIVDESAGQSIGGKSHVFLSRKTPTLLV